MKKNCPVIFIFISSLMSLVHAQPSMMLHRFEALPQRNSANPAFFFDGTASAGLPVISNSYLQLSNSSFRYSDFVRYSADDSLYFDSENMLRKLKSSNTLNLSAGTDLFHFGFKIKSSYIGFCMTEKINFHFRYPKEFMEFMLRGNGAYIGQKKEIGFDMYFEHRRDYALTYALELSRNLTIGLRVKKLYGMENIHVQTARASIYTHPQTLEITTEPEIVVQTSGIESNTFGDFVLSQYLFDRNNSGWAADIGFVSNINEKWSLSFSLNDMGSMTWQSLVDIYRTKKANNEFTYSGIDLNQFWNDTSGAGAVFQNMLDTLTNGLGIKQTKQTYKSKLPLQSYASAAYKINDKNEASLLLHFIKYAGHLQLSASLQYQWQPFRWLDIVSGISAINQSYFNPGLGLCISTDHYQFYVMSDNVSGALFPQHAKNISIRAGINFIVGRNIKPVFSEKKKAKSDR